MNERASAAAQRATLLLLLLLCVVAATCNLIHGAEEMTTTGGDARTRRDTPQPPATKQWLRQLFVEAEKSFDVDASAGAECRRDFERYKTDLRNQSVWAVRMTESAEWPYVGVFAGMVDHLGNWRECLKVSSRGLRGQYCRVEASYDFAASPKSDYGTQTVHFPDEEASVWDTIKMYRRDRLRLNRQKLRWALCVPSSCNSTDLEASLNYVLNPIFRGHELNITVDVNAVFCDTTDAPTFSAGFYVVSVFLITFIILVFICSIYNALNKSMHKDDNKLSPRAISKDFSLIHNYKKLVNTSSCHENPCLHFLKVVYMIMIIIVHQKIFTYGYPTFDTEDIEDSTYHWGLADLNCVDVLFAISGFLTFYYGFETMKKVGFIFAVISAVCRWLRMIPIFCIVMLFVMYVVPYLSSGPLWNQRIQVEVENCKASFWANFFSVGNIIDADKQCLLTSWYIMVDVQLSIVGGILLWIVAKNKKIGIFSTATIFVASTVTTFAVVFFNRFNGLMLLHLSFLQEPRNDDEFNYFYTATYGRIPPYLLGFAAGYAAKYLQELQYKFSQKQKILMIASSFGIKIAVIFYGAQFYRIDNGYSVLERIANGIYAATCRWLYVVVDLLLTVICSMSCFAWLQNVKGVVIPLGRLTYSVFLVSTVVLLLFSASQETTMMSSSLNTLRWNCSDVVYIYIVGFLVHLFFEAPLSRILKRLLQITLRFLAATENDAEMESSISSYSESTIPETKTESRNERNNHEYDNKIFENDELTVFEESTKI